MTGIAQLKISKKRAATKAVENNSIVIHGVSWQSYEKILSAFPDSHAAHFYYNQGDLEIMTLSLEHEALSRKIGTLIEEIATELGIDSEVAGSTTFKRKVKERGFEPDESFYFGDKIARIRGKKRINLATDPPPDLVVEIDITHSSLDRHQIFAAFGVTEVWRHDGSRLEFHLLENEGYEVAAESRILRGVDSVKISELVQLGQLESRLTWIQKVREYAHEIKGNKGEL